MAPSIQFLRIPTELAEAGAVRGLGGESRDRQSLESYLVHTQPESVKFNRQQIVGRQEVCPRHRRSLRRSGGGGEARQPLDRRIE